MCRRVRSKPRERLHTLPFLRDAPAPAALVRGDDDVDEPLEEVPLRPIARPPCVLECLVGFEERAGPCQREAALV